MATRAYVLIETAVGKTKEVVSALRGNEGMITVDAVTGPYDIIVHVEGPDLTWVGNRVTSHIHSVSGVTRTITCLAIELG